MNNKINVIVVEDNALYLQELCEHIMESDNICITGSFQNGGELLFNIDMLNYDVALIDMNLPDMKGIDVIDALNKAEYKGNILVITAHDDLDYLVGAFEAGAMGYILKGNSTFTDIEMAILDIMDGEVPLSIGLSRKLIKGLTKSKTKDTEKLEITDREQEILQLLSKGYTAKEVSTVLNISYQTVRTHLRNIYQKLDVNSLNQAVAIYHGYH